MASTSTPLWDVSTSLAQDTTDHENKSSRQDFSRFVDARNIEGALDSEFVQQDVFCRQTKGSLDVSDMDAGDSWILPPHCKREGAMLADQERIDQIFAVHASRWHAGDVAAEFVNDPTATYASTYAAKAAVAGRPVRLGSGVTAMSTGAYPFLAEKSLINHNVASTTGASVTPAAAALAPAGIAGMGAAYDAMFARSTSMGGAAYNSRPGNTVR